MSFFISDAHAQSGGAGAFGGGMEIFLMLGLMLAVMYFFVIRPQQKRARVHREMLEALGRGDKVVTTGGIIGKIEKVYDDGHIDLMLDDGVKLQFVKEAIAQVTDKKSKPKAS